MKTKHFLLLVSCLIPTLGHGYWEVTSCNEYSVPVFNHPENCKNPQTRCFTHPGYSSAKVTGCASTDCSSGTTWEEYIIGEGIGSSLGKCSGGNSSGMPECYVYSGGSYKCAAGCYGAANYTGTSISGCEKCPENATCANACQGCSFSCNKDYYISGKYCLPCPDHAVCSGGVSRFVCSNGYYKNSNYCAECPYSTDRSPASGNNLQRGSSNNATDITGCYQLSGYPFTDSTGSYNFSSKCYYSK